MNKGERPDTGVFDKIADQYGLTDEQKREVERAAQAKAAEIDDRRKQEQQTTSTQVGRKGSGQAQSRQRQQRYTPPATNPTGYTNTPPDDCVDDGCGDYANDPAGMIALFISTQPGPGDVPEFLYGAPMKVAVPQCLDNGRKDPVPGAVQQICDRL